MFLYFICFTRFICFYLEINPTGILITGIFTKLPNFDGYFDYEYFYKITKIPVEMCQFIRIPMTRLNVSFMLQDFLSVNSLAERKN